MKTNWSHTRAVASVFSACSHHAEPPLFCASLIRLPPPHQQQQQRCQANTRTNQRRWMSQMRKATTTATIPAGPLHATPPVQVNGGSGAATNTSPLARLSTATLLRTLVMGYTFSSPRLLALSLGSIKFLLDSNSAFLNADRNPVLRALLRVFIYDHFCAGTNSEEVRREVRRIKDEDGCSGVILGIAREILADVPGSGESVSGNADEAMIASWLSANLETLDMIEAGDYMNLKFTGAGPCISEAMLAGQPPPEPMRKAMDTICEKARSRGVGVWVDAEMQFVQHMVHAWAVDFMRRHNRDGHALVYNTYQAYLKSTRSEMAEHMKLAQQEGWTMGVKLVRGAYISNDIRERIWDTKPETDANYNGIVHDLLSKSWPGFDKQNFPDVKLFLAGHNKESIRLATQLVRDLVQKGEPLAPVQFGQLQGVADDVNFELVQLREEAYNTDGLTEEEAAMKRRMAPQPYKCLCWGSVADCLGFLMRRAVENASATERLKEGLSEIRAELGRRFIPFRRSRGT